MVVHGPSLGSNKYLPYVQIGPGLFKLEKASHSTNLIGTCKGLLSDLLNITFKASHCTYASRENIPNFNQN